MSTKKTRTKGRAVKLFEPTPREAPPKAWPLGIPPGGKIPPGTILRPKEADNQP